MADCVENTNVDECVEVPTSSEETTAPVHEATHNTECESVTEITDDALCKKRKQDECEEETDGESKKVKTTDDNAETECVVSVVAVECPVMEAACPESETVCAVTAVVCENGDATTDELQAGGDVCSETTAKIVCHSNGTCDTMHNGDHVPEDKQEVVTKTVEDVLAMSTEAVAETTAE